MLGINKIWPEISQGSYQALNGKSLKILEVKRLNVFIGANNSGKSMFIRQLFSTTLSGLAYGLVRDKDEALFKDAEAVKNGILNGHINGVDVSYISEVIKSKNYYLHNVRQTLKTYATAIERFKEQGHASSRSGNNQEHRFKAALIDHLEETGRVPFDNIELLENYAPLYIPVLRGMRPTHEIATDTNSNSHPPPEIYARRTIKDYFNNDQNLLKRIYTGEHLYQQLKEMLLGMPEDRKRVSQYQKLLSDWFFQGEPVTLIPKHDNDVVNVKIGDEEQRPIYDLGDGLQQIIIITACAFLNEVPTLIMIEEPEINLHPGLLRQLFLFLIEVTEHQYFVTTHSNAVLDLAVENELVTIYKVEKKSAEKSSRFTIQPAIGDRSVLAALGVKPSSVYFSNCTIWVEGITDRLYLRAFMQLFLKHQEKQSLPAYDKRKLFLENFHYSFVEYQGSNIEHWEFDDKQLNTSLMQANSTTSKAYVIADGDIKNKGDREERLKNALEDSLHVLPYKEIENVIPKKIVVNVCKSLWESFNRSTYGKNIELLEDLDEIKYASSDEGLGYHIDRTLGLNGKGKGKDKIFSTDTGTLKDKLKFCEMVISEIENGNYEATPKIINLCEKIYNHIEKHNQT